MFCGEKVWMIASRKENLNGEEMTTWIIPEVTAEWSD